MVKLKTAIIALLAAGSIANASDSGVYSFRAQRSLDKGKFAKGYNQLERALLASRKEADLLSEGRVLVAMAQIRTMSLDLNFADSLLSVVRKDVLDQGTLLQYTKVKVSLLNAQEKFKEAAKTCNAYDEKALKKADETAQAAFYGECAVAYAAVRSDRAPDALKMAGKRSDKKGGFYAFTAARMADLSGSSEADSLYRVAEEKAIKANKPYNTATILYYRSKLKSTPKNEVADLKARCKNAFELMGLPNNAKRCAE
ncbi:hypothetical protein SAMN05720487_10886 [Fibrobacter sp. UWT2]|uniref:hypothetical protein n=1 Tax=Fibrobacter sp. UWT2 TaxID=1896224 RepID=UPI00091984DD|nr:hypothetical protein [Fibrobacter sp. UWT2]SHL13449.1 hypothetical protein SAMN05720487_10886 [Fibrobacter sp. UWT2]